MNDTILTSVLESTGAKVYPLSRPAKIANPVIVYRRISSIPVITHNGADSLTRDRLQLTCVADSYSQLVALVASVRQLMNLNQTNFKLSYPSELQIEGKEDDIYYSILEYRIWD